MLPNIHRTTRLLWGRGMGCQLSLQRRHNERDGVSKHRRFDCLLNRSFRCRSKKISKLCVTDLCEGNPPGTGNVSIWWRLHREFKVWLMVYLHHSDAVFTNALYLATYYSTLGLILPWCVMIKTHVRGFFDTDLHEVSWHFATASWVLSSTDRVKISVKEAIQNGFLFLSHT